MVPNSQFYPVAGRVKDNHFITDFHEGVPYVEARVKGRLSEFIEQTEKLEAMNRLLPCPPFGHIQDPTTPQLAVQANIFDCLVHFPQDLRWSNRGGFCQQLGSFQPWLQW
ncbi:hypothetical protein V6N13_063570 [Hibiscus sabdariffa]